MLVCVRLWTGMGGGILQALVVLDYKLIIDSRTAADVQLGRGREAVSSRS